MTTAPAPQLLYRIICGLHDVTSKGGAELWDVGVLFIAWPLAGAQREHESVLSAHRFRLEIVRTLQTRVPSPSQLRGYWGVT